MVTWNDDAAEGLSQKWPPSFASLFEPPQFTPPPTTQIPTARLLHRNRLSKTEHLRL